MTMTADNQQTEYGVNVTNKFAFLGDDEGTDPTELLIKAQKEKKEKAKQKEKLALKAAAEAAALAAQQEKEAAAKKAASVENNENRRPATQHHQNNRSGERRQNGPRNTRDQGDKVAERFGEKPARHNGPREFNRGPRREGGAFRPRREGGNDNGGHRPPRKEIVNKTNENGVQNEEVANNGNVDNTFRPPPRRFNNNYRREGGPRGNFERGPRNSGSDRFSRSEKTGVKSVPKKDGHGAGNWGNAEEQLVGETEPVNQNGDESQPKVEITGNQPPSTDEQAAGEEENVEVEREKEAPQLTLSEWKAQHAKEKTEFKTRKANEGSDQKSLQKFVPIKRDEDNKKKETEEKDTQKKKTQRSVPVDIQVNFNDPNRREYGNFRRNEHGHNGPTGGRNNGGGSNNFRNNRDGDAHYNERRSGNNYQGARGPGPSRAGPPPRRGGPQLDMSNDFPALGAH